MEIVRLRRDGFARVTHVRRTIKHKHPTPCLWCGNVKKNLFQYGIEPDGFRPISWSKGEFCSKPCHDSYHS